MMQRTIRILESISELVGRSVSWLTILMVLTTFTVVLLRYGFGIGSIKLQESVNWMHAAVFLLGAGYTLRHDEHVRVDVFYRNFSPRTQAWVNLLGTLCLLLPVAGLMLWSSWDYVLQSWRVGEASDQVGGLPGLYLLKSIIPLTAILLMVQGVALLLRHIGEVIEGGR